MDEEEVLEAIARPPPGEFDEAICRQGYETASGLTRSSVPLSAKSASISQPGWR
jgi:hypothetical protein